MAVCLACLLTLGCGYGNVSPAAFQHAKALYTLANMKAAPQIDATVAAIDADAESGAITSQEADWLRAIGDQCRAEQWKDAAAAARRMMDDQVGR